MNKNKKVLLLSVFLGCAVSSGLHSSEDGLHSIDQFKLSVRTDHIVGSLWRNEKISDDEIEEAFSAISTGSEHSDISSDEGKSQTAADDTSGKQIESFIAEFDEVTSDIAKDRRKDTKSLRDFIEKVRDRGAKNHPIAVKYILRTIAEKY